MESLNQSQYNCKAGRDWREDGDVCTTKLLNTPIHLGSQDIVKAKYRFKEMKGVASHLLPSYLDEKCGVIVGATAVNKLSATFWST